MMLVCFKDCEPLELEIHDTDLASSWLRLVKTTWQQDQQAIFRDHPRYTRAVFCDLASQACRELGWCWNLADLSMSNTTLMHKDIEQFLCHGYSAIPEHLDHLFHELHFALHAIESGSQRNSWLQIEWYTDDGFEISADNYPAKLAMQFGDVRLQNPWVGHQPLFLYQQRDARSIPETCRFHDFVKPGICIVVDRQADLYQLDVDHYQAWFRHHANDWVDYHGWHKIMSFTGHPVVGRVRNLSALERCLQRPYLELDRLEF